MDIATREQMAEQSNNITLLKIPTPADSAALALRSWYCSLSCDPFPAIARVELPRDSMLPKIRLICGRFSRTAATGWRDYRPKQVYEFTPSNVSELRVDTNGVLYINVKVDAHISEDRKLKLRITIAPGAPEEVELADWIQATSDAAMLFRAFWNAPRDGVAATESGGDDGAGYASDDILDSEADLREKRDSFGSPRGRALSELDGASTTGTRSSGARALKLREVHEAAVGLSRIISNVNVNKEARQGLSRRQYRRKVLTEHLSELANAVAAAPTLHGSASASGAAVPGAPANTVPPPPPPPFAHGVPPGSPAYFNPRHHGPPFVPDLAGNGYYGVFGAPIPALNQHRGALSQRYEEGAYRAEDGSLTGRYSVASGGGSALYQQQVGAQQRFNQGMPPPPPPPPSTPGNRYRGSGSFDATRGSFDGAATARGSFDGAATARGSFGGMSPFLAGAATGGAPDVSSLSLGTPRVQQGSRDRGQPQPPQQQWPRGGGADASSSGR